MIEIEGMVEEISTKLCRIQTQIKAPKNMFNSFGKYKYRNAEGICEAVKPYLDKEGCSLTLSDEIVAVGTRIYVKATARIEDNNSGAYREVTAFAREAEEKKGMDESQITGSASSYARKYALNGLFLLDDTKDADSEEYHEEANARQSRKSEKPLADGFVPATAEQINLMQRLFEKAGIDPESSFKAKGISGWSGVSESIANQYIEAIQKKLAKANADKSEDTESNS